MNHIAVDSPEQQAEKTINERYHQLQAEVTTTVRHKLLARKMHIDESDLEEAYCQAWHGVYETIKRGKQISNVTGMLVEITWRRAVDTYRELHTRQQAALDVEQPITDLDLDAQLDDRIKFKRFIAQVRRNLNPRECEAVSLCVIHGYPRAEAAKIMGLRRRQIEKLMDGATKKISGIVASIAARGCGSEEWARLMRDYALGLIAERDRDYPRAVEHVAQCAACNRYVKGLGGLAAVLPVGPLTTTAPHSTGILAYLERLVLRVGHARGRIQGWPPKGALQSGATASGESTSGVASTLGTATLAKGVALVVAGAAAVTLATHGHKNHTRGQPRAGMKHTPAPSDIAVTAAKPLIFLRSPSATSTRRDASHVRTHPYAQHTYAASTHRHPPRRPRRGQPTQVTHTIANDNTTTQEPSMQAQPVKVSSNTVNKEFGWER